LRSSSGFLLRLARRGGPGRRRHAFHAMKEPRALALRTPQAQPLGIDQAPTCPATHHTAIAPGPGIRVLCRGHGGMPSVTGSHLLSHLLSPRCPFLKGLRVEASPDVTMETDGTLCVCN